jgi:tRNA threonylcarbamoyladenosine biosynthesis protein TsaB
MTFTGWLLAVETSGLRGSVALLCGSELRVTGELGRQQAGGLLPRVRDVLVQGGCRAANLSAYCFSRGPGSFTGLRSAATLGRMLAATVGCRVLGVPTLEVIASNALEAPAGAETIVAMLDARRGQVYAAAYRSRADGTLEEILPARVHDPGKLMESLDPPLAVVGAGAAVCREMCKARGVRVLEETFWDPSAVQVARLGLRRLEAGELPSEAESLPLYLRPPACEEVYEQRRAEARRRRGQPA